MCNNVVKAAVLLTLAIALSACTLNPFGNTPAAPTPKLPADTPPWITKMIGDYMNKPPENPPASVYRYEYKGQVVYYVPPPCCDQYGRLFDAQGQVLCAPDGGFTGRGDGKCPDFGQERKNGQLVWQDPRLP